MFNKVAFDKCAYVIIFFTFLQILFLSHSDIHIILIYIQQKALLTEFPTLQS